MKKVAIFLALFLCSSIAWADSEIKIPAPNDQQARYDRIWDAAIDTLFEEGLPIAFMSKTDGYMVTDKEVVMERGWSFSLNERVRVTMRFVRTNDSINVKISSKGEEMYLPEKDIITKKILFSWNIKGPFPQLEKEIVDKITSKLKPVEGTK